MKKIVRWILGFVTIVSVYFIYETDQLNSLLSSVSIPSNVQHTTIPNEGSGLITSGAYELFLKDNMILSGDGLTVVGYKKAYGTNYSTGSDEYQRAILGYNIYSIKSDLGITFQIDPLNTRLWYSTGWDDFSKYTIIVEQNDRIITAYGGYENHLLVEIKNIPLSGSVKDSIQQTIPKSMQKKCIVEQAGVDAGKHEYRGYFPVPLGADYYEINAAPGLSVCSYFGEDEKGCFDLFNLCGDFAGISPTYATVLYSSKNKIFYEGLGQDTWRTKDYGSNIIE